MKLKEIKKNNSSIDFVWDTQTSSIPLIKLRKSCPCAVCKEENKVKKKGLNIVKNSIDESTSIKKIDLIGNYGIKITWGDNHSDGIYSFNYLAELSK